MRWRLPLRRGSWRPGQAGTGTTLFVIQCAVLATCLIRGLDYLRPDLDPTSVLSRVQDSAPLATWGLLFVAAVVIVVGGMLIGWGTAVGAGHLLAMIVYAGIGYGLFLVTGLGPGVRTPAGLVITAVIHGALGVGTFAAMRRREEAEHPSSAS